MFKNILRHFARSFGFDIHKRNVFVENGDVGTLNFEAVTEFYLSGIADPKNVMLIQIGANDGRMHDPVYHFIDRYGLKACLVEPQPNVFQRLKENYKGRNDIVFENSAIAADEQSMTFYSLSQDLYFESDDFNFSGMSSFDKDHVYKNFKRFAKKYGVSGDVEDYVEEISVNILSFDKLLQKHSIENFDILQIDVEGYDFEVLKLVDFQKHKPAIVHFEHASLSDCDKKAAWTHLQLQGYFCTVDGTDTVALIRQPL